MDLIAAMVHSGISPTQARLYAPLLALHMPVWGIERPEEVAAFIARASVESCGFTTLEESLRYRDPARLDALFTAVHGIEDAKALIAAGPKAIANRIYANRLGNGDEASGDGWKYRGGGIFQLTGQTNYHRAGVATRLELRDKPELARQPEGAVITACWFWSANMLDIALLQHGINGITRAVNGPAMLGKVEMAQAYGELLEVLA